MCIINGWCQKLTVLTRPKLKLESNGFAPLYCVLRISWHQIFYSLQWNVATENQNLIFLNISFLIFSKSKFIINSELMKSELVRFLYNFILTKHLYNVWKWHNELYNKLDRRVRDIGALRYFEPDLEPSRLHRWIQTVLLLESLKYYPKNYSLWLPIW